jgi:hypothetical protein
MAKALLSGRIGDADAAEAAERAFDVRVVQSAVEFTNEIVFGDNPEGSTPGREQMCKRAVSAFSWLDSALAARAIEIEMPEELKRKGWSWPTPRPRYADCARIARQFRIAARVLSGVDRIEMPMMDVIIDSQLSELPIYTRYRYLDGRAIRQSVPILNSLERSMLYATALLAEDRWGMRHEVRDCPHVPRGEVQSHMFLDVARVITEGAKKPKPKTYCCPAHATALRQRRFHGRD